MLYMATGKPSHLGCKFLLDVSVVNSPIVVELLVITVLFCVVLPATSCNTQSSAPEDRQNNCPKHVELTGIIHKPLFLHLGGCLYYLYQ